jgi:hypothetical protein
LKKSKRGSLEEAETPGRGGGWYLTKFLKLKKFNEFDASRRPSITKT